MNDTSPEMEQRFRDLILARSGEDRLIMGCSMHATAQAIVNASLKDKMPHATPVDLRRELFLRFYDEDIDQETREKIITALKAHP
ncbi:MAG: hypothetical protein O2999_04445 [Nitrospirae bacterium]|nr:hypothetical protein [Nitrospirota bacterium]MDA1303538.1 hypothetical protein [Nitrospirota bacterium]